MSESPIVKYIQIEASKIGSRLLRNNRGQFYTIDGVSKLMAAVRAGDIAAAKKIASNRGIMRIVRAGVEADKSSDLVGIHPVTITQEMVGCTLGVALVVEVKDAEWHYTGTEHERGQKKFIDIVESLGGIGFFLNQPSALAARIAEKISEKIMKKGLAKAKNTL